MNFSSPKMQAYFRIVCVVLAVLLTLFSVWTLVNIGFDMKSSPAIVFDKKSATSTVAKSEQQSSEQIMNCVRLIGYNTWRTNQSADAIYASTTFNPRKI